jgi:hypothetical protein
MHSLSFKILQQSKDGHRTWMKIRAPVKVQINQLRAVHIQGLSHVRSGI